MQMRHEHKHIITYGDMLLLRSRLRAVMKADPHAGPDGVYRIRSLYFDTDDDRALHEKLDGLSRREKFRIRFYNNDESFIRLEKKIKIGDLGTKLSAPLTREETEKILAGDTGFLLKREEDVLHDLYQAMRCGRMRPKTIVDYTRQPFVYGPGNVRVTLDSDVRTGLYVKNIFDHGSPTICAGVGKIILEVKYDQYLPDLIRDIVQLNNAMGSAFSKYAVCREFEGM